MHAESILITGCGKGCAGGLPDYMVLSYSLHTDLHSREQALLMADMFMCCSWSAAAPRLAWRTSHCAAVKSAVLCCAGVGHSGDAGARAAAVAVTG